jgi:DNA-binding NtrC family response regulator
MRPVKDEVFDLSLRNDSFQNDVGESIIHLLQSLAAMNLVEIESLQSVCGYQPNCARGFDEAVECFEAGLIIRALKRSGGNQREAAKMLRLKPTTLNAKIKKYRINYRALDGHSEISA